MIYEQVYIVVSFMVACSFFLFLKISLWKNIRKNSFLKKQKITDLSPLQ